MPLERLGRHDKPSLEGQITSHRWCQVQGCQYDLGSPEAGHHNYNYRKRICPDHMQALVVRFAKNMGGPTLPHRFCQQCGRLQPVKDFQGDKRSCQQSLNRRRNHWHSILAAAKANASITESATTDSNSGAAEVVGSTGKQRRGSKKASKGPGSAAKYQQLQQQHQEGEKEGSEQQQAQEQRPGESTDDAGQLPPGSKVARRRRKPPSCRHHPYSTAATDCNDQDQLTDLASVDDSFTAAAAATQPQSLAADLYNREHITSTACGGAAAEQQPGPGALSMLLQSDTPFRGAGSMMGSDTGGEASAAAAAMDTAAQISMTSAAATAVPATGSTVPGQQQPSVNRQWQMPPAASQMPDESWCQEQVPPAAPLGGTAAAAAAPTPCYTSSAPPVSQPLAQQSLSDLVAEAASMPGPATLSGISGSSLRSQLPFSGPMPPQQQLLPDLKPCHPLQQHLSHLPAGAASMQPPPPAAAATAAGGKGRAGFSPSGQLISNATMTYLVNQLVAEMEVDASDDDGSVPEIPSDTADNQDTSLMIEVEMQRELALQQQQSQQLSEMDNMYSAVDAAAASYAATTVNANCNIPSSNTNQQVTFLQHQQQQQQHQYQQQQSVLDGSSLPTSNTASDRLMALCGAAGQGCQSKGASAGSAAARVSSTGTLGPAAADAYGAGNWPGSVGVLGHAAANLSSLPAAAAAAEHPQLPPSAGQIKQPQQEGDVLSTFTSLIPPGHAQLHHLMTGQQLRQAGAAAANDQEYAALSQLGRDLAAYVDQLQFLTGSVWDLIAELC